MTEKMLTSPLLPPPPSPTSPDSGVWGQCQFQLFSRAASTQNNNKDICTRTTCTDPGIFVRGGGPGFSTYFTVYRGGPMVLLHIFQGVGVSNFSRGGGGGFQLLISIETHITCDFPGGPDPISALWIRTWTL